MAARARRTVYTSMSARGKPSGSTRGEFMVELFCVQGQAVDYVCHSMIVLTATIWL